MLHSPQEMKKVEGDVKGKVPAGEKGLHLLKRRRYTALLRWLASLGSLLKMWKRVCWWSGDSSELPGSSWSCGLSLRFVSFHTRNKNQNKAEQKQPTNNKTDKKNKGR